MLKRLYKFELENSAVNLTILLFVRQINVASINNFKSAISNSNIYNKLNDDVNADPDANYPILDETITSAINTYLPVKLIKYNKHKHKKSNWITRGIIRSITFRDTLYRQLKQTNPGSAVHINLHTNLKTYNAILKRSIKLAKQNYYHARFEKCKHDIKNTWHTIKEILNRNSQKSAFPQHFQIEGTLEADKKIIAEKFNEYFASIGTTLATAILNNTNITYQHFLRRPTIEMFVFHPINEETTKRIINNISSKPSCGLDGLSSNLLKAINGNICNCITLVINQSLTTGIFPEKLKLAKVIPIHKKNDNTIFDNYRPISILPTISKVFERVIFEQINSYLNTHNLYYHSQYGFRQKHSTELAATELIDRVIQELDKGNTPISIYLDLSKAFDTIDHTILIHKLEYYGIKNKALDLFKSYLSNRKQYVQYDSILSDKADILTGVPQGSILGPLLFTLYINDIVFSSNVFKFIMYADDTTLFTTTNAFNKHQLAEGINSELAKVNEWLIVNKLSLNVSKTKAMVFHMAQKKINLPRLQMAETNIDFVDNFNFLGIVINKHLNWNSHISKIAVKISKTIGILNKLKHVLPPHILKNIYLSLIQCHLNYGILAWGHETKRIFQLQKKAVRTITASNYIAHTDPIFINLDLLKVSDIYKLQQIKFYYKSINSQLPSYFHNMTYQTNFQRHGRHTRASSHLCISRVNHEFAKKCIRFNLIHTINNTPSVIMDKIQTHSMHAFCRYAKKCFIQEYGLICNIVNCYVCLRYT